MEDSKILLQATDLDYYYDKFAKVMTTHGGQGNDDSHSITIAQLLAKKVDTPNYKPSTNVQDYLQCGLEKGYARDAFLASGRNRVKSPQNCPGWLCCLLPCLNTTPKMLKYFSLQSDSTSVYRGGSRFLIDSESLVVGDLISLYEGDVVPADCRIIESKGDNKLQFDISGLAGILDSNAAPLIVNANANGNMNGSVETPSIARATNVCWVGSTVHKGSCKAIVINVGPNTLWSRLISANRWLEK